MATVAILYSGDNTSGHQFVVAVNGARRGVFKTVVDAEEFAAAHLDEVVSPTVSPRSTSVAMTPRRRGR